jgi:hypothetical protein
MPKGMQPIYTQTISSGVNSLAFTNIPQTYTDLLLLVSARATGSTANQGHYIQFNGIGATAYAGTSLRGLGSSSFDTYRTSGNNAFLQIEIPNDLNTSNAFSNESIYIPNYTSGFFKQVIIDNVKESNSASTAIELMLRANLLLNTAPITSIAFGTNISAPNFATGSTFTLYGISR